MNLIPNFFLNLNSLKSRAVLSAIGSSAFYGIEYISNPTSFEIVGINGIMSNPILVAPPIIAAGAVVLPKIFLKKTGASQTAQVIQSNISPEIPTPSSPAADLIGKSQDSMASKQDVSPTTLPQIESVPAAKDLPSFPPPQSQEPEKIFELVDKRLGPVAEELTAVKNEVSSFKKDIEVLKQSLSEINSTFETSLVELKSFQAEMVNPINFMRKYFESMDIKTLSDPAMPFRPVDSPPASMPQEKPRAVVKAEPRIDDQQEYVKPASAPQPVYEAEYEPSPQARAPERISRQRPPSFESNHSMSRVSAKPQEFIRHSIERGLTPGKIMSIIGIVDEVLATMGPDGVDLILEQYKNMGLKAEEERLIYGVLKMLNESKMQTDDIIAMLYRFGQVLGLNDDEAELQYTRLMANRKSRKTSLPSRNKIREAVG